MNAEFVTTDEVGQYFMTKDTEEFSQFTDAVACREYTLPRDEKSSVACRSEGAPTLDLCWKSQQLPTRYIWSGKQN